MLTVFAANTPDVVIGLNFEVLSGAGITADVADGAVVGTVLEESTDVAEFGKGLPWLAVNVDNGH